MISDRMLIDGGNEPTSSTTTSTYIDPAANVPTNPGPTVDFSPLSGIIAVSGSSTTSSNSNVSLACMDGNTDNVENDGKDDENDDE